jgi:hypothetical protein
VSWTGCAASSSSRATKRALRAGFDGWARLGSNQRPLACEASYLGLQILQFAGGSHHGTAQPSPSGHHEFQGIPRDLETDLSGPKRRAVARRPVMLSRTTTAECRKHGIPTLRGLRVCNAGECCNSRNAQAGGCPQGRRAAFSCLCRAWLPTRGVALLRVVPSDSLRGAFRDARIRSESGPRVPAPRRWTLGGRRLGEGGEQRGDCRGVRRFAVGRRVHAARQAGELGSRDAVGVVGT